MKAVAITIRVGLLAMACFLTAGPSQAQPDVRPDTADWRGYHPLEVGNVWEWRTSLLVAFEQLDQWEIIGDTLVDGQRYFVQASYTSVVSHGNPAEIVLDTLWIRYDSTATRIVARSPQSMEEWAYTCDLAADFGGRMPCEEFEEVNFYGGPADGVELSTWDGAAVPFTTSKSYCNLGYCLMYYHGVGPLPGVGDGDAGTIAFTYLRIGGVEYGSRAIRVDVEAEPQRRPARVSVYPNPAHQQVWIDSAVTGSQVTLFDALGRTMGAATTCSNTPCGIDVSAFPAGRYMVRVDKGGKGDVEAALVVVR